MTQSDKSSSCDGIRVNHFNLSSDWFHLRFCTPASNIIYRVSIHLLSNRDLRSPAEEKQTEEITSIILEPGAAFLLVKFPQPHKADVTHMATLSVDYVVVLNDWRFILSGWEGEGIKEREGWREVLVILSWDLASTCNDGICLRLFMTRSTSDSLSLLDGSVEMPFYRVGLWYIIISYQLDFFAPSSSFPTQDSPTKELKTALLQT